MRPVKILIRQREYAQAYLNLRLAHISEIMFSDVAAHNGGGAARRGGEGGGAGEIWWKGELGVGCGGGGGRV